MIQEAEYANMTNDQQMAYLRSLMARWDYANTIDFAREEGEAIGDKKRSIAVAKLMLADNESMEKIVRYSGLTEEQVRAL